MAAYPTYNRRFPIVSALRAMPPYLLVAAGSKLLWPFAPIFLFIPLSCKFWIKRCEIRFTGNRKSSRTIGAAVTFASVRNCRLPFMAVLTLPPVNIVAVGGHLHRCLSVVSGYIPLFRQHRIHHSQAGLLWNQTMLVAVWTVGPIRTVIGRCAPNMSLFALPEISLVAVKHHLFWPYRFVFLLTPFCSKPWC